MSEPTHPVYTFKVNLETLERNSWLLPYMTQPTGNQTEAEADNFKFTRSTWTPDLIRANYFKKHDDTFTVSGLKGQYLKDTYATGEPDAVLIDVTP